MGKQDKEERLYRIGEAATALDLKTSVLRFWESEFPQLEPIRTPKGQRLYSEENMAVLGRIQSLLHEQGMTIEGAKRVLAGGIVTAAPAGAFAGIPASRSAKTQVEEVGDAPEFLAVTSVTSVTSAAPVGTEAVMAAGSAGNLLEQSEILAASGGSVLLRDALTAALTDALTELQSLRQLLDSADPGATNTAEPSVLSKGLPS